MGYTHYWRIRRDGDQAEWAQAVGRALPIVWRFADTLNVEALDHVLNVNGVGDDAHEWFAMPTSIDSLPPDSPAGGQPEFSYNFCKTGNKPYDVPVAAFLAVLEHYAPNCINVSSDGAEREWQAGVECASRILGDNIEIPLWVREKQLARGR